MNSYLYDRKRKALFVGYRRNAVAPSLRSIAKVFGKIFDFWAVLRFTVPFGHIRRLIFLLTSQNFGHMKVDFGGKLSSL